MFWGLVLKTNKRYSQQVTKAFHVSQAVLDLSTVNSNDNDAVVQVWLNTDETDHLIANVSRQTSHVQLDLTFTEGESVAFYSKGSATVHLTGYLLPDDDFGDCPGEEEEESDEEVQVPTKQKPQKKAITAVKGEEEEEDSDDDEDDSDDDLDLEGLTEELEDEEMEDDEDSDEDDADDDDEDDDDDEEDEEEEEDSDEIEAPQSKKVKLDKAAKQNGLTNGKLSKKENEKQKNQQKNQKQDKQEQKQKQPQHQQQNQQKKPTPKTLKGGVIVEDLRVGKGPEAQAGKKISVYYEGRLKSNNKVFDSTKVGDGFKFTLGRGEVIQGWDIGVVGMKVGSKRRITCPPNVAYGNKGAPPQIPGNATLVFDVELRNIK